MSRKHKNNRKLPNFKAPSAPAEPPDIDEAGELAPHEKAMLSNTVQAFGEAAGQGITQLPAEFRAPALPPVSQRPPVMHLTPNVPIVPNVQNAGYHPVFKPGAGPVTAGMQKLIDQSAAMAEAGQKIGAVFFAPGAEDPGDAPVFMPADDREELAEAFEQMTTNLEVGAELFATIRQPTIHKVISFFQQEINRLLIMYGITGHIGAGKVEPLDLRGLVALTHRGQEDRHNRRALLDLCARLNISAAELTLTIVKTHLEFEAWRLGDAAAEIPELTSTPENEELWRAYLMELGLLKRPGR
jgi:hypothetical protein